MATHKYFGYFNNRSLTWYPRYTPHFKHPKTDYYALAMVPLDLVLKNFSHYRKFILVRHPLQRVVAAYYEVRTQKATSNHTSNLTQFVTDLVLTNTINFHWLDYQQFCYPCQVHYDYVMKLETMKSDSLVLNGILGANPDISYSEVHVNKEQATSSAGAYKYDDILREWNSNIPRFSGRCWTSILQI